MSEAIQHFLAYAQNDGLLPAVAAGLFGIVAVLTATKRAAAFYAADRAVPPLLSGMATSAAFLSSAPFLGLAGTLYVLGSDGLAWLVGLAAGLVLMGVLIAPAFRASGALTVPEFLAKRYGGRLVPLLGALVVLTVCFVLLAAQLTAIGDVASRTLEIPQPIAIGAAAIVVALVLVAGGMRSATWLGVLLLAAIIIAYLLPLAGLTLAKHGSPLGPLAYGQALQELPNLEVDMISEGLADPASLKPHTRPFLQLDYANTLALIFCLMAGTAVLPHVLMRNAVTAGVRQTRMSMAWALLFTTAMLASIPAYAALTKHEIYRVVAKGVPFAELPDVFARDGVSIHGTTLGLYQAVAIVTGRNETADAQAVSQYLQRERPKEFALWAALRPQVRDALVTAAKAAPLSSTADQFETWRRTLLPVAATAAGNKTGKLTQSAIAIEPTGAAFVGFELAGLPRAWVMLFSIGAILAGLAAAIATAWAVAQSVGYDLLRSGRESTLAVRSSSVVALVAAAAVAVVAPADVTTMATWTFSIAAAALFPAIVLGIWWPGTTRAAAIAGMLAGLIVTLGYIGGSYFAPVPFFEATGGLSDAGSMAGAKVAVLQGVADKASVETKPAAEAALVAYVRGTPYKAGAANWFGIHNSAAALFGLPLGFFITILVSLLTRRPSAETLDFVRAIRRPSAASLQAD
jgi:cation/acetate symporter